jgi:hypothetical protein
MSAPEAAYFPAFEDRRADPEDPGEHRLALALRALRARVHFLEARCRSLEDQRPAPDKLTLEQIAILDLCARVSAIEAGNGLKSGSAISES